MSVPGQLEFFVDANRCIGCQACVAACSECEKMAGRIAAGRPRPLGELERTRGGG